MIEGSRIFLQPLEKKDAPMVLAFEMKNRAFFEQFSIDREDDYYSLEGQIKLIDKHQRQREQDQAYYFGIFLKNIEEFIGSVALFKVERGPAQSAMVGYTLDQENNGKGYMTEAVQLILHYAFNILNLHRVEAGVMPINIGSIKVLEKAGFHKEGLAKQNVKIRGKWEDHQMMAIINPHDERKI
ncbi:GNAT family N-acetyltransferase [Pullulanibacillus pueri]|uniref:GNAT family N-acetyltransferase n=1 Tax=Pullulanibacillus pueri TaxID=1437324 RepID=UPI0016635A68|nr:GNAT family protein [Pullulanibacillus pueri]